MRSVLKTLHLLSFSFFEKEMKFFSIMVVEARRHSDVLNIAAIIEIVLMSLKFQFIKAVGKTNVKRVVLLQ